MINRNKKNIKTVAKETEMKTNNTVFNIRNIKDTIEKAKKSSQVPAEIIEIVEALYQTYENMEYGAGSDAPYSVRVFIEELQKKLRRAQIVLESQISEKTNSVHISKKDLFGNFRTIVEDYKDITTLLARLEKDMMVHYSGKQPKNYGKYPRV